MAERQTEFRAPPSRQRDDGQPRHVGFELEFSDLSLDTAAACVSEALGGDIEQPSVSRRLVRVDSDRTFEVTVDWEFLNRTAAEHADAPESQSWLQKLSDTATLVVPIEIVCPPLPIDQLDLLNPMVTRLREAGATGTRESLVAAYGVHINVEPPSLHVETIAHYLKAFGLLQWWLEIAHDVDLARNLSPYIRPYPEDYVDALLRGRFEDVESLMDHYLEHNATRNRALDLLPLFAEFDQQRVHDAVDDSRIKSRPALHYRLPNCEFDDEDQTLIAPWNIWCVVEELACRPDWIDELGQAFLASRRPLIGIDTSAWTEQTKAWLQDHELV